VYEYSGPFCYFKAFSKSVNFGFWRGADMDNSKQLLSRKGEKMRNVKLENVKDIDEKEFGIFIRQA